MTWVPSPTSSATNWWLVAAFVAIVALDLYANAID